MLRSSFIATALLCLIVSGAGAATIHVPGDQPTIQAGLEIAVDGDTVSARLRHLQRELHHHEVRGLLAQ